MWIEKLKDGKFRYAERYLDPLSEKQKKISIVLDSDSARAKKEAQRVLNDKIAEIDKKRNVSDVTFHELYNEYYKNWAPTIKASSLRGTIANDKRMLERIDKKVLARKVDRRLIQQLVNEMMDDGFAFSYYNSFKKRFHAVLDFGVRMGYLETNEAHYVKAPKKPKTYEEVQEKRESYLELAEMKKLIKAMRTGWRVENMANMVELMAFTGVRYGEAAALKFSDVDFENGVIDINKTYDRAQKVVTTPKTDFSYRKITIPENVKQAIRDQQESLAVNRSVKGKDFNPENYVFFTVYGQAVDLDTLNVVIRRYAEKIGIKKHLTSHIFRHSHVALLAELGIPLAAAMDRLGHTDYKTTLSIYSHVTESVKIDIVKKLENL